MSYLQTKEEVIARYMELGVREDKIYWSELPVTLWSLSEGKVVERGETTDGNSVYVSLQLHTHLTDEKAAEINNSAGIIVTRRSPSTGNLRWANVPTRDDRPDRGVGYVETEKGEVLRYTGTVVDNDIERIETMLGPARVLCEMKYVGDGDVVENLNRAVEKYVAGKEYNEYIDMNMDNPWVRIIIVKTGIKQR